jgi:hypothetical protein
MFSETSISPFSPWSKVLIEKLMETEAAKKNFAFYVARKFNTLFRKSLPLEYILSQKNPVSILIYYIFKTHFNIIIPSTFRSPKWAPLFTFSDYMIFMPMG